MSKDLLHKKLITLALGGSFNPIHTQHVEIMQIAKEHLESISGHDLEVVEGFLAPSTDSYLLSKMKRHSSSDIDENFVIKSEHRIRMCNMAIEKYPWLKPISKCFGSAYECGEQLKSSPDHEVVIVIGADRATTPNGKRKWRRVFKKPLITVIIGRNDQIKDIRRAWDEDVRKNLVVHADRYFLVDQVDTRGVSSTRVRKEIARDLFQKPTSTTNQESIIESLVKQQVLNDQVGRYLLENQSNLFL